MTGHQAIAIIQNIPLPRRDDFCIRAMILALPKNKSLTVPEWVRYKLEAKRQQGGRDDIE